jgi:uncharacterized metal-binding protein YceD (DUF177 family)
MDDGDRSYGRQAQGFLNFIAFFILADKLGKNGIWQYDIDKPLPVSVSAYMMKDGNSAAAVDGTYVTRERFF